MNRIPAFASSQDPTSRVAFKRQITNASSDKFISALGTRCRMVRLMYNGYWDYLGNLSALLCDPVYCGTRVPHGKGSPVLLIPGFMAGDWTLFALDRWLRHIGYRPYLSGIDINLGCAERKLETLQARAEQITDDTGERVTIIGHSLGGILGRALAALKPALVRDVIGLGSPCGGGWHAVRPEVRNAFLSIHSPSLKFIHLPANCGTELCSCGFAPDGVKPMPSRIRFTSIYTRDDEIVDWSYCIDGGGDNIEVKGLHGSLVVNPQVYRLIAMILATRIASIRPLVDSDALRGTQTASAIVLPDQPGERPAPGSESELAA
jgi:pimeloyl-ACP methyl ester carboxylesterase